MIREAKPRRLKIQPERETRTQQGVLLDDVDFNEVDLSRYDIRNPETATQTDVFKDNASSNYSNAISNTSIRTPTEGERREQQQRQTSNVWMM